MRRPTEPEQAEPEEAASPDEATPPSSGGSVSGVLELTSGGIANVTEVSDR